MVENCSICGSKLEDDVKFCPECGEKIPLAKGTKEVETKVKSKAKTKEKKTTIKFSLPKISLKNAPKPVIAGIALLCVAIIAVAGVVVISPFDMTGSVANAEGQDKGGRVFAVDIENTCDTDAECHITVSGLTYTHFGNGGYFTVPAGETTTVNIVEDVLFVSYNNYKIRLIAEIEHQEEGIVDGVAESIGFTICPTDEDGEFSIETNQAR